MENFLIKLWKLGTSVIFFPLPHSSYFPDPPSSACQGLPAGTHTGKAPFPPSASTPRASGFAESHSQSSSSLYFGNTGAHLSFQRASQVTQLIYGNLLHAPDHSSPVAPAEEPKISCFPHKSQSPVSKFVASEGLRCDLILGVIENHLILYPLTASLRSTLEVTGP